VRTTSVDKESGRSSGRPGYCKGSRECDRESSTDRLGRRFRRRVPSHQPYVSGVIRFEGGRIFARPRGRSRPASAGASRPGRGSRSAHRLRRRRPVVRNRHRPTLRSEAARACPMQLSQVVARRRTRRRRSRGSKARQRPARPGGPISGRRDQRGHRRAPDRGAVYRRSLERRCRGRTTSKEHQRERRGRLSESTGE